MDSRQVRPDDHDYPVALHHLAPRFRGQSPALYLRGRLPHLPGVAIVGTRQPSQAALHCTRDLTSGVARGGYSVWSGGAIGIDTAAHETALNASTPTVVVMAGGLDDPYPRRNSKLFQRVLAAGGALISVHPDGTPRRQWQFLLRNAVLAALSDAMVVVQAPSKSGALSASRHARELNRPVFVIPHSPWDPLGAGSALELVRGATPITNARQLVQTLTGRKPIPPPHPTIRPPKTATSTADRACASSSPRMTTPESRAVWANLGPTPRHIDILAIQCKLPVSTISATLLALTLEGIVVEEPKRHFRRA